MLSFSAVFVDWCAVGGCGDMFEVNRWNVSGTKPARSLPSLWGKPRQIIRELTATKIEWARFSLFGVCVPAMRFSLSRSLSIPHSFPPAVILVLFLFEHSQSLILTWLLAYLLHYQASVSLVKCICKCLHCACACVWMFACEQVTAPHWFVGRWATDSASTIGSAFLYRLSTFCSLANVLKSIQQILQTM